MIRKGLWSPDEDEKLRRSISKYVNGSWNDIARKAGLQRCGRSCRQRWLNHLRPGLRKEKFSKDEVKQVMELQSKLGNRWSEIAAQMKGRTDNEVKNLWNTVIKRRRLYMFGKSSPEEDLDLLPQYSHADSPSRDTASSQSASSSHSSWSLHVSSSPADVDFCSTLASHGFVDELSEQLLMMNGPDLSEGRSTNGGDGVQQAASGQLSYENAGVMHPASLIPPPLSPCDWDCAAKLVDVDATLAHTTPTFPCKSLQTFIMESASSHHRPNTNPTFSFTPSPKTSPKNSLLECTSLPSFQSREYGTLLSKALDTPPSIGNGHYLRSSQQQSMPVDDHQGSQNHAPSPYPINIMNHEDRSNALNLGANNDAYDDLSPTSSILQTSFNHRFEYGTQDIIATLLWNGGC